MSNISTCNNLVISGNQTITGNIISSGNIQTTNISSTSINNSTSITTNSLNGTSASLTNLSVSKILSLLSATPISFNYNGSNYNLSSLMLYTLQQLSGLPIASQSYVQTQISNLSNSSPDLLNTLSELSNAINNDPNFNNTMLTLIATKAGLTSNNNFTGTNNTFTNLPYYVNASDQLINKTYVDTRFTNLLTTNNTFTNSNSFTGTNTNISNLYSTILSVNNNNTRRSVADIFEASMGQTSSYIYFNNVGTFGLINTVDSTLNWYITLSGNATIPIINSVTGNIATLNVTTASTFQNLPNYINTSDKLINKAYVDGRFTTLLSSNNSFTGNNSFSGNTTITTLNSTTSNITTNNVTNLNVSDTTTTSKLSIGSNMRAGSDLMNISLFNNGSYIYFNNTATLGAFNVNDSTFPWLINMSCLGSFRTVTTTTANITTDNVGTLNVSGTATITKLSINSSMRSNNDLFNCSTSSTGPYLFIGNDATIGTYDTNTSSFPWFVEMDGDATFKTINCPKISYQNEQLTATIITTPTYSMNLQTTKLTLMNSTSAMTVNLSIVMSSAVLNNMFEFRILTSPSITFNCSAAGAIIIDLNNDNIRTISSSTKNYYRFYYTYYNNLYTYILLE